MAKVEWKKFDIVSVGKICALLGLIGGFIMGLIMAAISGIAGGIATAAVPGMGALGAGLGIAVIIIFPIFYAIGGFISGVIGAFLYNIIAGKFGGIIVEQ